MKIFFKFDWALNCFQSISIRSYTKSQYWQLCVLRENSIEKSFQTFVYNSILLTGIEFNCTVRDFVCPQHWFLIDFNVITARKRSLGQGSIFRSVCQEFCPQCMLGYHTSPEQAPPWTRDPPDQAPPWSRPHQLSHTPPGADPPLGSRPPLCSACWEIRSTSGRYASYWNAILFKIIYRSLYCKRRWISVRSQCNFSLLRNSGSAFR